MRWTRKSDQRLRDKSGDWRRSKKPHYRHIYFARGKGKAGHNYADPTKI